MAQKRDLNSNPNSNRNTEYITRSLVMNVETIWKRENPLH